MKDNVHSKVRIFYTDSEDRQTSEYRFIPIDRYEWGSVADKTAYALSEWLNIDKAKRIYLIETPSGEKVRIKLM